VKDEAEHRREVGEFISSLPPADSLEGRLARFGVGLFIGALLAGFVWFIAYFLVELADGPPLHERLGLASNAPLTITLLGVSLLSGVVCLVRGDRAIAPLLMLIRKLGRGEFD
jgi:hypothetical protein